MKSTIKIICIVLSLNSCVKKEKNTELNPNLLKIDTSRISIIKYEPTNNNCKLIFEDAKPATLNDEELNKIEDVINKIIEKQNPLQIQRFKEVSKNHPKENYKQEDFILKKKDYIRRYLVVINSKGQKEIFVALVCDFIAKDFDFRYTLKQGHGGGSCLFSFKLNFSTNKYYDVQFNTEA